MEAALQNKTFLIKTFGCQMNSADTQRMSVLLSEVGAKQAQHVDDADIILINGCEIREKAVGKALSSLGVLRKSKTKKQVIGMGGCVGQLEGSKLFSRNPHLDFVFGTDTIDELPEILQEVFSGGHHIVYNAFDKSRKYSTETKIFKPEEFASCKSNTIQCPSAFVNIMKGCDKFCSFCIVPYTRGREKSRTLEEVVEDVERLVSNGIKEVVLLGQNVNSYGKGTLDTFPKLLQAIDQIPDLKRIRFTSSHPTDFSDELIECYGTLKKLCPQLHLPVQSGSNSVLEKMQRHYKIETYYEQIQKWRKLCKSGGLSTDIILGFPTETEEDFELTLKLLEDLRFDLVYSFAYSPRPGTKAALLKDDVPHEIKHERLLKFQKKAVEIACENNQKFIHQTVEVLVETQAKAMKSAPSQNMFMGRTPCGRVVNFPYDGSAEPPEHREACGAIPSEVCGAIQGQGADVGRFRNEVVGKFINLEITSATGLALTGKIPDYLAHELPFFPLDISTVPYVRSRDGGTRA